MSHKLNLETICDMALYEADSQATPEEKKVLKRLAPTLKASAEILTQLMAELDKAAFANRAFEQRCQDQITTGADREKFPIYIYTEPRFVNVKSLRVLMQRTEWPLFRMPKSRTSGLLVTTPRTYYAVVSTRRSCSLHWKETTLVAVAAWQT